VFDTDFTVKTSWITADSATAGFDDDLPDWTTFVSEIILWNQTECIMNTFKELQLLFILYSECTPNIHKNNTIVEKGKYDY